MPRISLGPEVISHMADDLIGQCMQSLDDWLEKNVQGAIDQTSLAQSTLDGIDAVLFWCDGCGWCCSTDELNNEAGRELCDQCNEEED